MSETAIALPLPSEPGHWLAGELRDDDWRLAMPPAVLDELGEAARLDPREWTAAPASMGAATRGFLARVREHLFHGAGVVVAGRLPLAEWGEARARGAVHALAHLMGPPVEQTRDGVSLYAVEDRGVQPRPGVRRSLTNVSQPFHSDGPWVRRPPSVVGLHCIRAARNGGLSQCISLRTLFADLGAESPALLARLERDFLWHRQGEHAPGEAAVSRHPMLWRDDAGHWCARYYCDYVVNGYRSAGVAMDDEARAALAALERLSVEPARRLEFALEEGEVVWVNNRWCAHSRTAFEPSASTDHPRLLVRVWHRFDGAGVALDG